MVPGNFDGIILCITQPREQRTSAPVSYLLGGHEDLAQTLLGP